MNPFDFVRQAGAVSESDTERDGAFSHHAETHAAGIGAGVVLGKVTKHLPALPV